MSLDPFNKAAAASLSAAPPKAGGGSTWPRREIPGLSNRSLLGAASIAARSRCAGRRTACRSCGRRDRFDLRDDIRQRRDRIGRSADDPLCPLACGTQEDGRRQPVSSCQPSSGRAARIAARERPLQEAISRERSGEAIQYGKPRAGKGADSPAEPQKRPEGRGGPAAVKITSREDKNDFSSITQK
jgi:hypothetical protein